MNILLPGRHHILTNYQKDYLKNLVKSGVNGEKVDSIIFVITSANHENTRRNPIPLYLRTMMIDKFSQDLGCKVVIYPVADVRVTDKFAEYLIKQISYQFRQEILPENTILACSTPSVINQFAQIGFSNLPIELNENKSKESYNSLRPFEVVNLLRVAGDEWRNPNSDWRIYASKASVEVYDAYGLGDLVVELFNDALLTQDADITETRNYSSYAFSMDKIIDLKFADIKPFIREGKIVDVGCSTGSLIRLLAHEYPDSDIIGVEAVRKFYEFAKSQEYESPLVFFYRRNITDQNFKDNSVHTFIYSSVMHEVYSYIGEDVLEKVINDAYKQLVVGGRLIIRDVVGPENPRMKVYMELNQLDGESEGDIKTLSTYAKFFRFAKEFARQINFETVERDGKQFIILNLVDAYEYMSKMTYVENWESELHEEFGFYSFNDWKWRLEGAGFKIVPGSKEFTNPYIISKYEGRVRLYEEENGKLEQISYPATNIILAAEK